LKNIPENGGFSVKISKKVLYVILFGLIAQCMPVVSCGYGSRLKRTVVSFGSWAKKEPVTALFTAGPPVFVLGCVVFFLSKEESRKELWTDFKKLFDWKEWVKWVLTVKKA